MLIKPTEAVDIDTPSGKMRTHLFRPAREGSYSAIILYSEIYQMTAPIERLAAMIAGHGMIVAVPEVYHEYEAPGTVLSYDQAGTDRGNELKYEKPVAQHDSDLAALISVLREDAQCNGRFGAFGVCLGGHLSFRAALNPAIEASVCFYATDLHTATLGAGRSDDSLRRAAEIKGEVMMVWGLHDPHVPYDGRRLIRDQLEKARLRLSWHEVDGQHAFLRDGAPRFDATLFLWGMSQSVALYQRHFSLERPLHVG